MRQKSDKAKRKIAFFTALSFASAILVIWVTIVLPDIKGESQSNVANALTPSPVDNFLDTLSGSFTQVKNSVGQAKDAISNFASTTQYYQNQNLPASTSIETTKINEEIPESNTENIDINQ